HDAVLDAVVHHLDEMAATAGSAVQVAVLGGSANLLPPRRTGDIAASGRDRLKDRVKMLYCSLRSADHHAVAAFESPDASAGSNVQVMNALRRKLFCAANVVNVIRVATINQDVARFEVRNNLGNGLIHYRCRDQQPDRP